MHVKPKKTERELLLLRAPLLTLVFSGFIQRLWWISVSKLLGVGDQRFLNCLVPSQNHHLLGSQVDGENRAVLLGELRSERSLDF